MPLMCPKCSLGALRIDSSIELPPDCRSDEIAVQIARCSKCGFAGLAIYEESRRGTLDIDSVNHRGYYVKTATLASIQKLIKQCPEPKNPQCKCPIHSILGHVNGMGQWDWLDDVRSTGTFKLRLI